MFFELWGRFEIARKTKCNVRTCDVKIMIPKVYEGVNFEFGCYVQMFVGFGDRFEVTKVQSVKYRTVTGKVSSVMCKV